MQSLSRVRLFATPWTAARQASLSITNCQSLPKPMSMELVKPSNHLILCHPPPPALNLSQYQGLFKWVSFSHQVAKVLEFQLQHQSWEFNFYSHSCMKSSMEVLQKFQNELPYDPAIPFLDMYLKELKSVSWRDICTLMFIAALFTIAKIWKQAKCPTMEI